MDKYKPVVGKECEISNFGQPFEWCVPRFLGETLCVVDHKSYNEQFYPIHKVKFRPIRTQEEIEREEAITIVMERLGYDDPDYGDIECKETIVDMIDAGYRLVGEKVKCIDELIDLGVYEGEAEYLLKHYDIYKRKVVK